MTEELDPDSPGPPAMSAPRGGSPADPGPAASSIPPLPATPVSPGERITAVDTLRGVAVLGILIMNIYAFSMPTAAYFNPDVHGGATGVNRIIWFVTHLLAEGKFFSIFSMLFGAGLVLMYRRAESRGTRFTRTYLRRLAWLLVIGAVHAYLFWDGDILFVYGACGFLIVLFRRRSPRTLLISGLLALVIGSAAMVGFGSFLRAVRSAAESHEARVEAGEEPTEWESRAADIWGGMRAGWSPTPEQLAEEIAIHRGSYLEIAGNRALTVLGMHLFGLPAILVWHVSGVMLIGMALMKLGVLSGDRSAAFYTKLLAAGYGIGFPLVAIGATMRAAHDFDGAHKFLTDTHLNTLGAVLVALGHTSVVMLVSKSGALPALRSRLAAVGRMALTCYLAQTLICTTLFYGYGLGLYGHLSRLAQMGVVVGIWIVLLTLAPLWFRHFRIGPAEWLWRSLTYGRRQPFRLSASPATSEFGL